MGIFAYLKGKYEAKKTQTLFDLKLSEWILEQQTLARTPDTFIGAIQAEEPADNQLLQNADELALSSTTTGSLRSNICVQ